MRRQISALTGAPTYLERRIIGEEKKALIAQTDEELSHTSATVLKKYKTGARLSAVENLSVKTLTKTSVSNLSNMKGIGPKSARIIKSCADAYAQEVRQNAKIHISPDPKSNKAYRLVRVLYQWDNLEKLRNEAKQMELPVPLADKHRLKTASIATNPLKWLFSRQREEAIEAMTEIQELLVSPVVTQFDNLHARREKIMSAKLNDYWSAFCDDPARYYSILSSVKQKGNGNKRNTASASSSKDNSLVLLPVDVRRKIEAVSLNTNGLTCVLRPYQIYGVKYILCQRNVLLGDEMGLGKTVEAIATMVSLRNSGSNHFIVVCPASVLVNWEREIKRHSDLTPYVLHGPAFSQQCDLWLQNGGVAITNYENTGKMPEKYHVGMVVVDEAHYIKNAQAKRTANTIKILRNSDRRLFMTGTALENKLDEMLSLIGLLQPEVVKRVQLLRQPVEPQQYRSVISSVYFRRTKDAVWEEMPRLQEVEEVVELTEEEREKYIQCVKMHTMEAFTQMRQISFLVKAENSSKLSRIQDICTEAVINGRKVIIFSSYLNTIEMIRRNLEGNVFGPITGAISPETRQTIIDDYSKHSGGAVLLSQIIAGGTGLNIQKASIVIICEPQYKPSIENQAIARAYRIGQTSNVTVYRMLCRNTVDERILQIVKDKQQIFDAYADKSISGEKSLGVDEKKLAEQEFENSMVS